MSQRTTGIVNQLEGEKYVLRLDFCNKLKARGFWAVQKVHICCNKSYKKWKLHYMKHSWGSSVSQDFKRILGIVSLNEDNSGRKEKKKKLAAFRKQNETKWDSEFKLSSWRLNFQQARSLDEDKSRFHLLVERLPRTNLKSQLQTRPTNLLPVKHNLCIEKSVKGNRLEIQPSLLVVLPLSNNQGPYTSRQMWLS